MIYAIELMVTVFVYGAFFSGFAVIAWCTIDGLFIADMRRKREFDDSFKTLERNRALLAKRG
jgi:hypothetical protein